jgi:hypothetical protein
LRCILQLEEVLLKCHYEIFKIYRGKGKDDPVIGHEGPEEKWKYSCTLSLTSALDGVDGQCHTPVALLPGKRPYTLM